MRTKAFVLALLLSACGSDSEGTGSPDASTDSLDAASADTWESYASGFFVTYCHECHGPGDTLRDYSLRATIESESAKILCGVAIAPEQGCTIPPRQFPIGNGAMPSDAERTRLVDWIQAGTP